MDPILIRSARDEVDTGCGAVTFTDQRSVWTSPQRVNSSPPGPPQTAHSQSNQCQIMGYLLNNQKGIIALDVKEAVRGEHYLSASSKN